MYINKNNQSAHIINKTDYVWEKILGRTLMSLILASFLRYNYIRERGEIEREVEREGGIER